MPSEPAQPGASPFQPWRCFGRWTLYVAVAASLFWLDWFGFEARSRVRTQDLLNQVFATWYAEPPWFARALGGPVRRAKPPVVVLVTEDDLAARGVAWPPPYGFHRAVLDHVRELEPDGVLVDVLFADARDEGQRRELFAAFRGYGDDGTPVVLACGADCECDAVQAGLRQDVLDAELGADVVQLAPVPRLASHLDGIMRRYPLMLPIRTADVQDPAEEPLAGLKPRCRTAAFQLHRSRTAKLAWDGVKQDIPRFDVPMEIMWGPPHAGASPLLDGRDCEAVGWLRALGRVLVGGEVRYPCPSSPVFTAGDVLGPARQDVADAIRGAPVVYGMDLLGAGDRFSNAIHGRQAGAYVHAMALDNLRRWEDRYVRRTRAPLPGGPGVVDLVVAVFAGLLWALAREEDWVRWRVARLGAEHGWIASGWRRLPAILYWPLALLVALVAALAVAVPSLPAVLVGGVLAFQLASLAPVNVAGQLFVTGTAELVERFLHFFDGLHAWAIALRTRPAVSPEPEPEPPPTLHVSVRTETAVAVAVPPPDHDREGGSPT